MEFPAFVDRLQNESYGLKGRFVYSSNYTFLVELEGKNDAERIQAVYKPARGERPLWDFPDDTLAHRERAAYLISEALGYHFVPPTVFREDGLLGPGSLQLFIPHDPDHHYFNIADGERASLRQVVFFDLLVNNADRKGGHMIFDEHGKMWLIDHGICFHVQDKYRSVIWDFAGQRIPARLRSDAAAICRRLRDDDRLQDELAAHLRKEEIAALLKRAERLSKIRSFPMPPIDRPAYPWPPV